MSTLLAYRPLALSLAALLSTPRAASAAPAAYQSAVTADGPVLYFQFNEATGAAVNHGSLGSTFDASYLGTPTRQAPTSAGDTGVAFDAVGDYLESGAAAPAELLGNPTFSAEVVFFVPTNGTAGLWAPFLHWGPSDGTNPGSTAKSVYFSFSNNSPTEAYAGFYNGGLQSSCGSLARGSWHHYVWVRTGGGTDQVGSKVYLDGVDVTSTLRADPDLCCDGSTPIVGSTAFRVNRARDFETQRWFKGTIDELALYETALTAEQVRTHFAALGFIFGDNFDWSVTCAWSSAPGDGVCPCP